MAVIATADGAVDETGSGDIPLVKLAYGAAGDATVVPAAATGLLVNPAKIDPVNDKVSLGANGDGVGALSVHRLLFSANSVNATVVKDTPGVLQKIIATNIAAGVTFLKLYDKATSPANTDTPVMTLVLAADMDAAGGPGAATFDFGPYGVYFTAGIGYRLCGAAGGADNATTVVAVGDVTGLHLFYK